MPSLYPFTKCTVMPHTRALPHKQFYLPPPNWQIRISRRRCRTPDYKACVERRRRVHSASFHALDQHASGKTALLDDRLMNRRERRVGPGRERNVVESDHGEVLG